MFSDAVLTRFWKRVDKRGSDECWNWTGPVTKGGYGRIGIGAGVLAYSTRLAIGTVSPQPGMFVLHSCDNPRCCNPAHLRWGTTKDNAQDAIERGRFKVERGSQRYNHKLSDDDVRAIRLSNDRQVDLAARYGVTQALISLVKLRKSWAHVED